MANMPEYAVAVGNVGEDDHNTIVLPGVDVIVPLELDLDCDPLQDDEVRLRSRHGAWQQTLRIGDRAVRVDPQSRLAHYRFSNVPFGYFDAAVRVGGRWVTVVSRIIVRMRGVFGSGGEITDAPPAPAQAAPPPEDPKPADRPKADEPPNR